MIKCCSRLEDQSGRVTAVERTQIIMITITMIIILMITATQLIVIIMIIILILLLIRHIVLILLLGPRDGRGEDRSSIVIVAIISSVISTTWY